MTKKWRAWKLELFKHKPHVPVPLRPQLAQVRLRIDYKQRKIMWWDAANRTEIAHVNRPGYDLEAKIVDAFIKAVVAKLAKREKLSLRSSTILLDPEYIAAQHLAAVREEKQAEVDGEEQAGAEAEE